MVTPRAFLGDQLDGRCSVELDQLDLGRSSAGLSKDGRQGYPAYQRHPHKPAQISLHSLMGEPSIADSKGWQLAPGPTRLHPDQD
jgi:hypothetical protein